MTTPVQNKRTGSTGIQSECDSWSFLKSETSFRHCVQYGFSVEDVANGKCRRIALLSQEGSVIAYLAMTRGVVPQTKCFRMDS